MATQDWATYFKTYRENLEAEKLIQPDDETHVTTAGHQIELTELPRGAKKIITALNNVGFDMRAGMSETVKENKTTTHYWLQAKHYDGMNLWCWWEQGTFKGALHNANGHVALIDSKQKERTGETPTGALQGILDRWTEACIF